MASTLVEEFKRRKIQEMLLRFGARKTGEHIGQLAKAIYDGNLEQANQLIQQEHDLEILSSFRVDLVGIQIANQNVQMLALLLEHKMPARPTHLINAIRKNNLSMVDLLLRYGLPPEEPDDYETPLMTAAAMGNLKIVQRLVDAGADVNRSAPENIQWTAAFCAKRARHTEISNWLNTLMSKDFLEQQAQDMDAIDPKFRVLYEYATAGDGITTDEIFEALSRWDQRYGVTVKDVNVDRLTVSFASLPDFDKDNFYGEVLDVCPDVSDYKADAQKDLRENQTLYLWWD